jgi:hypothetical protein
MIFIIWLSPQKPPEVGVLPKKSYQGRIDSPEYILLKVNL